MNGFINVSTLNIDGEDIHFRISIANYQCKTELDFYGFANDFTEFGERLTKFPKNISDVVTFEVGQNDPKWAYYMLISASCYDASGHGVLKIIVTNMEGDVSDYRTEFSIFSEAASINLLGKKLLSWNPLTTKEILWESNTS